MARAIDRAGIHFRTLNGSKGPAVRATRAQADRVLYKRAIRELLDAEPNLTLLQQNVDGLLLDGTRVRGVVTQAGMKIAARHRRADGRHVPGRQDPRRPGELLGRPRRRSGVDRPRARACASSASPSGRLKTGTPPRIDGRTIDYTNLAEQPGDTPTPVFSFLGKRAEHPRQISCHITHTTERTHEIIRQGTRSLAAVHGRDRRRGPALLPVDRGQGRALRRSHAAPDLHRARGPVDVRDLSERHLDVAAVRRAARARALDPRLRERAHHAARLRDRVRLLRSARPQGLARNEGDRGPVLRGPDQRHHRLRGSRRAGHRRRHQRGASRARARAWYPRREERYIGVLVDDLDHARHDRAVPHVHVPRRVPPELARGQRRPAPDAGGPRARRRADERWRQFEARRDWLAAEAARLHGTVDASVVPTPGRRVLRAARARGIGLRLLRRPGVGYAGRGRPRARRRFPGPWTRSTPRLVEQWTGSLSIEAHYAGYVERQSTEIERQKRETEHRVAAGLRLPRRHGLVERAAREARANSARPTSARPRAFPA